MKKHHFLLILLVLIFCGYSNIDSNKYAKKLNKLDIVEENKTDGETYLDYKNDNTNDLKIEGYLYSYIINNKKIVLYQYDFSNNKSEIIYGTDITTNVSKVDFDEDSNIISYTDGFDYYEVDVLKKEIIKKVSIDFLEIQKLLSEQHNLEFYNYSMDIPLFLADNIFIVKLNGELYDNEKQMSYVPTEIVVLFNNDIPYYVNLEQSHSLNIELLNANDIVCIYTYSMDFKNDNINEKYYRLDYQNIIIEQTNADNSEEFDKFYLDNSKYVLLGRQKSFLDSVSRGYFYSQYILVDNDNKEKTIYRMLEFNKDKNSEKFLKFVKSLNDLQLLFVEKGIDSEGIYYIYDISTGLLSATNMYNIPKVNIIYK